MSPSKVSDIKWDTFYNVVDGKNRTAKEQHYGIDPATGEKNWGVPIGNQQDVDDAVVAAQRAYEKWRDVPFEKRKQAVEKFKELYSQYTDELTELLKKESGKPVGVS